MLSIPSSEMSSDFTGVQTIAVNSPFVIDSETPLSV